MPNPLPIPINQGPGDPKKPMQAVTPGGQVIPFRAQKNFETGQAPVDLPAGYDATYDANYIPFQGETQEQNRWRNQSTLGTLAKGVTRFAGTTLTKAATGISDVLGYVFAAPEDNVISQGFRNVEKSIKDSMPVSANYNYYEGSVLDKIATGKFFVDNVVDGAAFLASAYLTGGATKGLVGAIGSGIGKIGTTAETAARLENAIVMGTELTDLTKGQKLAYNMMKAGLSTENVTHGSITAINTMSEALAEGYDTYTSMKDDLIHKQLSAIAGDESMAKYLNMSDADIEQKAKDASRATVGLNMVALLAPNWMESKWMFGTAEKGVAAEMKAALKKGGQEALDKEFSKSLKLGKVGKEFLKNAVSEGAYEENIQSAIQSYEQQIFNPTLTEKEKSKVPSIGQNMWTNLKGAAGVLNNSTMAGTEEGNGAEAIWLGAALGGIGGAGGHIRQHFNDLKTRAGVEDWWSSIGKTADMMTAGYMRELKAPLHQGQKTVLPDVKDKDGNIISKGKEIESYVDKEGNLQWDTDKVVNDVRQSFMRERLNDHHLISETVNNNHYKNIHAHYSLFNLANQIETGAGDLSDKDTIAEQFIKKWNEDNNIQSNNESGLSQLTNDVVTLDRLNQYRSIYRNSVANTVNKNTMHLAGQEDAQDRAMFYSRVAHNHAIETFRHSMLTDMKSRLTSDKAKTDIDAELERKAELIKSFDLRTSKSEIDKRFGEWKESTSAFNTAKELNSTKTELTTLKSKDLTTLSDEDVKATKNRINELDQEVFDKELEIQQKMVEHGFYNGQNFYNLDEQGKPKIESGNRLNITSRFGTPSGIDSILAENAMATLKTENVRGLVEDYKNDKTPENAKALYDGLSKLGIDTILNANNVDGTILGDARELIESDKENLDQLLEDLDIQEVLDKLELEYEKVTQQANQIVAQLFDNSYQSKALFQVILNYLQSNNIQLSEQNQLEIIKDFFINSDKKEIESLLRNKIEDEGDLSEIIDIYDNGQRIFKAFDSIKTEYDKLTAKAQETENLVNTPGTTENVLSNNANLIRNFDNLIEESQKNKKANFLNETKTKTFFDTKRDGSDIDFKALLIEQYFEKQLSAIYANAMAIENAASTYFENDSTPDDIRFKDAPFPARDYAEDLSKMMSIRNYIKNSNYISDDLKKKIIDDDFNAILNLTSAIMTFNAQRARLALEKVQLFEQDNLDKANQIGKLIGAQPFLFSYDLIPFLENLKKSDSNTLKEKLIQEITAKRTILSDLAKKDRLLSGLFKVKASNDIAHLIKESNSALAILNMLLLHAQGPIKYLTNPGSFEKVAMGNTNALSLKEISDFLKDTSFLKTYFSTYDLKQTLKELKNDERTAFKTEKGIQIKKDLIQFIETINELKELELAHDYLVNDVNFQALTDIQNDFETELGFAPNHQQKRAFLEAAIALEVQFKKKKELDSNENNRSKLQPLYIALLGISGSGKSSMAKSIFQYYQARTGNKMPLFVGHTEESAQNLANIIGLREDQYIVLTNSEYYNLKSRKDQNENDDATTIYHEDHDFVIADEQLALSSTEIISSGAKSNKADLPNAAVKDNNRHVVLLLGDPSQPRGDNKSFLSKFDDVSYNNQNIKMIQPLFVGYRTFIPAIESVAYNYKDNPSEVKIAQTVANLELAKLVGTSIKPLGVIVNSEGDAKNVIISSIKSRLASYNEDNKAVVIVNSNNMKEKYEELTNLKNSNIEVLSIAEVQGRTFAEAYIDIDKSKRIAIRTQDALGNIKYDLQSWEESRPDYFNSTMYMSITRSKNFTYIHTDHTANISKQANMDGKAFNTKEEQDYNQQAHRKSLESWNKSAKQNGFVVTENKPTVTPIELIETSEPVTNKIETDTSKVALNAVEESKEKDNTINEDVIAVQDEHQDDQTIEPIVDFNDFNETLVNPITASELAELKKETGSLEIQHPSNLSMMKVTINGNDFTINYPNTTPKGDNPITFGYNATLIGQHIMVPLLDMKGQSLDYYVELGRLRAMSEGLYQEEFTKLGLNNNALEGIAARKLSDLTQKLDNKEIIAMQDVIDLAGQSLMIKHATPLSMHYDINNGPDTMNNYVIDFLEGLIKNNSVNDENLANLVSSIRKNGIASHMVNSTKNAGKDKDFAITYTIASKRLFDAYSTDAYLGDQILSHRKGSNLESVVSKLSGMPILILSNVPVGKNQKSDFVLVLNKPKMTAFSPHIQSMMNFKELIRNVDSVIMPFVNSFDPNIGTIMNTNYLPIIAYMGQSLYELSSNKPQLKQFTSLEDAQLKIKEALNQSVAQSVEKERARLILSKGRGIKGKKIEDTDSDLMKYRMEYEAFRDSIKDAIDKKTSLAELQAFIAPIQKLVYGEKGSVFNTVRSKKTYHFGDIDETTQVEIINEMIKSKDRDIVVPLLGEGNSESTQSGTVFEIKNYTKNLFQYIAELSSIKENELTIDNYRKTINEILVSKGKTEKEIDNFWNLLSQINAQKVEIKNGGTKTEQSLTEMIIGFDALHSPINDALANFARNNPTVEVNGKTIRLIGKNRKGTGTHIVHALSTMGDFMNLHQILRGKLRESLANQPKSIFKFRPGYKGETSPVYINDKDQSDDKFINGVNYNEWRKDNSAPLDAKDKLSKDELEAAYRSIFLGFGETVEGVRRLMDLFGENGLQDENIIAGINEFNDAGNSNRALPFTPDVLDHIVSNPGQFNDSVNYKNRGVEDEASVESVNNKLQHNQQPGAKATEKAQGVLNMLDSKFSKPKLSVTPNRVIVSSSPVTSTNELITTSTQSRTIVDTSTLNSETFSNTQPQLTDLSFEKLKPKSIDKNSAIDLFKSIMSNSDTFNALKFVDNFSVDDFNKLSGLTEEEIEFLQATLTEKLFFEDKDIESMNDLNPNQVVYLANKANKLKTIYQFLKNNKTFQNEDIMALDSVFKSKTNSEIAFYTNRQESGLSIAQEQANTIIKKALGNKYSPLMVQFIEKIGAQNMSHVKQGAMFLEADINGQINDNVINHEFFHFVFRYGFTSQERAHFIALAKKEAGISITDDMFEVEEKLAILFEDFMKGKKLRDNSNPIKSALYRILDVIKEFFGLVKDNSIDSYFEKVRTAKFVSYSRLWDQQVGGQANYNGFSSFIEAFDSEEEAVTFSTTVIGELKKQIQNTVSLTVNNKDNPKLAYPVKLTLHQAIREAFLELRSNDAVKGVINTQNGKKSFKTIVDSIIDNVSNTFEGTKLNNIKDETKSNEHSNPLDEDIHNLNQVLALFIEEVGKNKLEFIGKSELKEQLKDMPLANEKLMKTYLQERLKDSNSLNRIQKKVLLILQKMYQSIDKDIDTFYGIINYVFDAGKGYYINHIYTDKNGEEKTTKYDITENTPLGIFRSINAKNGMPNTVYADLLDKAVALNDIRTLANTLGSMKRSEYLTTVMEYRKGVPVMRNMVLENSNDLQDLKDEYPAKLYQIVKNQIVQDIENKKLFNKAELKKYFHAMDNALLRKLVTSKGLSVSQKNDALSAVNKIIDILIDEYADDMKFEAVSNEQILSDDNQYESVEDRLESNSALQSAAHQLATNTLDINKSAKNHVVKDAEGAILYTLIQTTFLDSVLRNQKNSNFGVMLPFAETKAFSYNIFHNAQAGQFISSLKTFNTHSNTFTGVQKEMATEGKAETVRRTFSYGFLAHIYQTKDTGTRYYQDTYPLSIRQRVQMAEVNVLSNQEVSNGLDKIFDYIKFRKNSNINTLVKAGDASDKSLLMSLNIKDQLTVDMVLNNRDAAKKIINESLKKEATDLVDYLLKFEKDWLPDLEDVVLALHKKGFISEPFISKNKNSTYIKDNVLEALKNDKGKPSKLGRLISMTSETKDKDGNIVSKTEKKYWFKHLSETQQENTRTLLIEVMSAYVKNRFVNSYHLNQMIAGDFSLYKAPETLIKRLLGTSAPGMSPMIGKNGMSETTRTAVFNDLEYALKSKTKEVVKGNKNEAAKYIEENKATIKDLMGIQNDTVDVSDYTYDTILNSLKENKKILEKEFLTVEDESLESISNQIESINNAMDAIESGIPASIEDYLYMILSPDYNMTDEADMAILDKKVNEILKAFKNDQESTDGFSFMSQKGFDNLSKGMNPYFGLASTIKAVYFGIHNHIPTADMPTPLYIKNSYLVITDELADNFPELKKIRDYMDKNNIHEIASSSSIKVGAPKSIPNWTDLQNWSEENSDLNNRVDHIVEVNNAYRRIQYNPKTDTVSDAATPTQMMYMQNTQTEHQEVAMDIYSKLAYLFEKNISKFNDGLESKSQLSSFIKQIIKASPEALFYFEDIKNKARINPAILNDPTVRKKFMQSVISKITKNSVNIRFKGAKMVLAPAEALNLSTPLNYRWEWIKGEKRMVADIIVPKSMFEGQSDMLKAINKDGKFFETGDLLALRLPTTGKGSGVVFRVVGTHDNTDNVVFIPAIQGFNHGSDFDIDTLFFFMRESLTETIKGATKETVMAEGMYPGYVYDENDTLTYSKEEEKKLFKYINDKIIELEEFINNPDNEFDVDLQNELRDKRKQLQQLNDMEIMLIKNSIVESIVDNLTNRNHIDEMTTPISSAFEDDIIDLVYKNIGYKNDLALNLNLSLLSDMRIMQYNTVTGLSLTGKNANMYKNLAYMIHSGLPDMVRSELMKYDEIENGRKLTKEEKADESLTDQNKEAIKQGRPLTNEEKLEVNELLKDSMALVIPNKGNTSTIDAYKESPIPKYNKKGFSINGIEYNSLSEFSYWKDKKGDMVTGMSVWAVLNAFVNDSIDNSKNFSLGKLKLDQDTISAVVAAVAMGMPFNYEGNIASMIAYQPAVQMLKYGFYEGNGSLGERIGLTTHNSNHSVNMKNIEENKQDFMGVGDLLSRALYELDKDNLDSHVEESIKDGIVKDKYINLNDYLSDTALTSEGMVKSAKKADSDENHHMSKLIDLMLQRKADIHDIKKAFPDKTKDELIKEFKFALKALLMFKDLSAIGDDLTKINKVINTIRTNSTNLTDLEEMSETVKQIGYKGNIDFRYKKGDGYEDFIDKINDVKFRLETDSLTFDISNFLNANPHIYSALLAGQTTLNIYEKNIDIYKPEFKNFTQSIFDKSKITNYRFDFKTNNRRDEKGLRFYQSEELSRFGLAYYWDSIALEFKIDMSNLSNQTIQLYESIKNHSELKDNAIVKSLSLKNDSIVFRKDRELAAIDMFNKYTFSRLELQDYYYDFTTQTITPANSTNRPTNSGAIRLDYALGILSRFVKGNKLSSEGPLFSILSKEVRDKLNSLSQQSNDLIINSLAPMWNLMTDEFNEKDTLESISKDIPNSNLDRKSKSFRLANFAESFLISFGARNAEILYELREIEDKITIFNRGEGKNKVNLSIYRGTGEDAINANIPDTNVYRQLPNGTYEFHDMQVNAANSEELPQLLLYKNDIYYMESKVTNAETTDYFYQRIPQTRNFRLSSPIMNKQITSIPSLIGNFKEVNGQELFFTNRRISDLVDKTNYQAIVYDAKDISLQNPKFVQFHVEDKKDSTEKVLNPKSSQTTKYSRTNSIARGYSFEVISFEEFEAFKNFDISQENNESRPLINIMNEALKFLADLNEQEVCLI